MARRLLNKLNIQELYNIYIDKFFSKLCALTSNVMIACATRTVKYKYYMAGELCELWNRGTKLITNLDG